MININELKNMGTERKSGSEESSLEVTKLNRNFKCGLSKIKLL